MGLTFYLVYYFLCNSLQVEKYDFKRGGHQPGTGHFTQVVWKDTRELGMARAKSKNGSVYVVARYRPAGNNVSSFDGNVLPTVGWSTDHINLNIWVIIMTRP